jgi:hypothetical protein
MSRKCMVLVITEQEELERKTMPKLRRPKPTNS